MSKIEELISKYCPNGVEYKKLCELTFWDRKFSGADKIIQPKTVCFKHVSATTLQDIRQLVDGTIALLSTGNFSGATNSDFVKDKSVINTGEIISIPSGGSAIIKYYKGDFIDSGNILAVSSDTNKYNLKFIYHCLLEINNLISKLFRGAGIKHPSMLEILQILIPVPPMPVQEEIVKVLDSFTELEAELEAELEVRKKQYEYYRDLLFTFDDYIPLVKLGDISAIIRGGSLQKKDFQEKGVPCIHYGQIYTKYKMFTSKALTYISEELASKQRKANHKDIIMAITSENIEDICKCIVWLGNEPASVSGHTAIISTEQNPKYLAYYFNTTMFYNQKVKLIQGTKVMELSANKLKNVLVPIPPLAEQERIVAILDKFDALVNDISVGLPAEINARRKQYEYWRNKLLDFKKAE